jgi:catechol 2,3-dioxygenase-like lactoylglutathione lyase family enzyme
LGEAVQITIGTPAINESFEFYEKIGFRKLREETTPVKHYSLTDGSVILILSERDIHYTSLTYLGEGLDVIANDLDHSGIKLVDLKTGDKDKFLQADFFSPFSGLKVTLMNCESDDVIKADGKKSCRLGEFGEFTISTENLEGSIKFWSKLGFSKHSEDVKPYPWAVVDDGLLKIGLHQTKDIKVPTITYYAPDMYKRIAELKEDGLTFTDEILDDNGNTVDAILKAPEGQSFFLLTR